MATYAIKVTQKRTANTPAKSGYIRDLAPVKVTKLGARFALLEEPTLALHWRDGKAFRKWVQLRLEENNSIEKYELVELPS